MDTNLYRYQLLSAKRCYERTGDRNGYMVDNVYSVICLFATALAEKNPAFKHLPLQVSLAKYGIKSAVDMCAHRLVCPVEYELGPLEFLAHFVWHGKHHLDRDLDAVHAVLHHLGF